MSPKLFTVYQRSRGGQTAVECESVADTHRSAATMSLPMAERLETRPHWQIALILSLAMRVIYSGAAALFSVFLHPDPQLVRSNTFTNNLPAATGVHYALLDIWQRFDTLWYLHIAANGYDR